MYRHGVSRNVRLFCNIGCGSELSLELPVRHACALRVHWLLLLEARHLRLHGHAGWLWSERVVLARILRRLSLVVAEGAALHRGKDVAGLVLVWRVDGRASRGRHRIERDETALVLEAWRRARGLLRWRRHHARGLRSKDSCRLHLHRVAHGVARWFYRKRSQPLWQAKSEEENSRDIMGIDMGADIMGIETALCAKPVG